jgi:hypothetical protein
MRAAAAAAAARPLAGATEPLVSTSTGTRIQHLPISFSYLWFCPGLDHLCSLIKYHFTSLIGLRSLVREDSERGRLLKGPAGATQRGKGRWDACRAPQPLRLSLWGMVCCLRWSLVGCWSGRGLQ